MSKKKEKKKWKFLWKNINGLGMVLRVAGGIALLVWGSQSSEENALAKGLSAYGVVMILDGLLRWCPLRALLKNPTKRAYLRHYPEVDQEA